MKTQLSRVLTRALALMLAFLLAVPPVYVRAEDTDSEDTSHEHTYGENDKCACGELNPEHEHSYASVVTAPTCTAAGFTTYTCACGDSYTGDEQAQLSHAYGENGKCTCGALDPAHEHTYAEGKCVCGEEESAHEHTYGENDRCTCGELNPEHEHNYTSVVTAPTCTAAGFTTYTCACGDSYTGDEQAQLSHAYGENGKCTCGALDPAHEHTYAEGKCVCGEEESAHEHTYGENDRCACGELNPDPDSDPDPDVVVTPDNKIDETNKGPLLTSTGPGSTATEQVICGVAWKIEGTTLILSKATTTNPYDDSCECEQGEMCQDYAKSKRPWASYMDTITALVVESDVTRLCNRVCNGSTTLTSANLGSITSMGERCFQDCTALTSITLPSTLSTLGKYVFAGCTALKTADLKNTQIKSVPEKTFTGCSSLTMVSLPGTVTSISSDIFADYTPASTTYKVNKLTTVYYNNTLIEWNKVTNRAVVNNPNLNCTVFCTDGIWANGYTSSGANMCYKLAGGTLTIRCFGEMPDYAEGAAPWAASVDTITTVVFEGGITSVGNNAFYGCKTLTCTYEGLETLKENSRGKVGNTALFGEEESEGGEGGEVTPTEQVSGGIAWTLVEGVLTISPATTPADGCDAGKMPDYTEGAAPWAESASAITCVVLEEDVTRVGAYAFAGLGEVTYTYDGDKDALKTNSVTTGNEIFFGVEEDPEPGEDPEQVTCGVAWKIEGTTLILSKASTTKPYDETCTCELGEMCQDYAQSKLPWNNDMKTITALDVRSGVTSLCNRACNGATALTSVSLPEGLITIGDRCFSECAKLSSISIPSSVTSLGATVFNGCFALTEIDLSETGITSLGEKVFAACTGLTTLKLPETVVSVDVKAFGSSTYNNIEKYPSALKTINYRGTLAKWEAIENTTAKTNKYLNEGKTSVQCAYGAVWNAKYASGENWRYDRATNTLALSYIGAMPDFEVGGAPWYVYANDITIVTFVDGITSVGNNAFYGCKTLTCTYEGLETLKENSSDKVGNTALFGEEESEGGEGGEVTQDENVTGGVKWTLSEDGTTLTISATTTPADGYDAGKMPDYTMESAAPWAGSATTITSVVLATDITRVGAYAFADLGETVTYIYTGDKDTLKTNSDTTGNEIFFGVEEDPEPEEDPEQVICGVAWKIEGTTLILSKASTTNPYDDTCTCGPGEMCQDYAKSKRPWASYMDTITALVVESDVTSLCNRVCNGFTTLTSANLGSITSMGERCFQDCTALTSVTFSSSLTDLGSYAFTGCKVMEVVDLSRTKIQTLPTKTFAGCGALTTVSIPETVTSIAADVFCDYDGVYTSKLTRLNFSGTLAMWNSFTNRAAETNPNLANGTCTVYCMEDGGIWNAKYTSVDNLCYKLENGALTIRVNGDMPDYAEGEAPWFARASEITAVILEDGTTSVGANAFDDCVNMTDVTLPEGLIKVGQKAFADCENLTSVHFLGTPAQWTTLQQASEDGNGPLFGITITSGYNGVCGDNATWEYDPDTKTLAINGTGPMWDWNRRTYKKTPWILFNDEIEKISIGYGITATGRFAFCYMSALKDLEFVTNDEDKTTVEVIDGYSFCLENQLTTLTLPEGVRFIAGRAFSQCESVSTLYLPSTLESIDMYAFQSEDASVTINKVVYNGTQEDWERKVYVSTQGDQIDQLFENTEWIYLKEYTYYDDVSDQSWYADSVYYLKDQGMIPGSGTFGVDSTVTLDWVLNALYVRAGSSGAYTDALDWAKAKSVVGKAVTMTDTITLDALCDILYRTTLYNGNVANLGDGTAAAWCETMGYIPEQLSDLTADTVLTRMQAATVLSAYLQSSNGSASRYDEMREDMKTAYETSGGDGKMHILALHHAGTGKVGDSTLILLPGGEVMLIDTFRNDGWENYLKATLETLGVKKLDYLVLSHGHEDHDDNLTDVINYIYRNGYTVGNYWSAGSTTSARETAAINLLKQKGNVNIQNRLRAGQQMTIGSGDTLVTVDILWPMESGKGYNTNEDNDGSLTMKLTYGDSSYLCGGDLFLTAEEDILELYKDNLDALKADVMKTNHHGSYSSNGSDWVAAVDPKAMITHSDDTGDSAQCYEYSQNGRAWFSTGRDGGILVTMDSEKNITVTTGYDTNLRQDIVSCGMKGHTFENQKWKYDEHSHWRKCSGYWLCGVMDSGEHRGGTATCQNGKICVDCGYEYTEVGNHDWVYTGNGNVITATCSTCPASAGSLTLILQGAASVYDGTEKIVRVSGTITGMTVPTVTYIGDRTNAGTFTASIEVNGAKAELAVTISKRDVIVTAADQAIALGDTISDTAVSAEGLLDGHKFTATLTPSTDKATTDGTIVPSNAVITAEGSDVTANYNITYVNGKLVIENPTADAEDKSQVVEDAIIELPVSVEPDDDEAAEEILAVKEAYDALSDYEKTLVDAAYKQKLDKLVASLTDYKIIEGNGSTWDKGEDGTLTLTANGSFRKFVGIEVNGKPVDEQHYEAKSGSTIITLKQSYLDTLPAGTYTLTVLYTDGETEGEFTVQAYSSAEPTTPDDDVTIPTIPDDDTTTPTIPEIDAAEKADAVEEIISKLPASVDPDDEEAAEEILAAKKAYDALSDSEKALVDASYKKKLDELILSLTDYKITKGDGSKWTKGSSSSLSFTANGPYSKFIGIEVNGYEVDERYYAAKSGSTVITLKLSFLKNLAAGKHTITVIYTDGEATAEFTVQAKATTPATGDDSMIMFWTSLMFISVIAMVALIVCRKPFACKGKYLRK